MPVFTAADTLRPDFDICLELLCCLPVEPVVVTLSAVVEDLNLNTQAEATAIIDRLRKAGFMIRVCANGAEWNPGKGKLVYIAKKGWPAVQGATEGYWEKVWEAHPQQDAQALQEATATASI